MSSFSDKMRINLEKLKSTQQQQHSPVTPMVSPFSISRLSSPQPQQNIFDTMDNEKNTNEGDVQEDVSQDSCVTNTPHQEEFTDEPPMKKKKKKKNVQPDKNISTVDERDGSQLPPKRDYVFERGTDELIDTVPTDSPPITTHPHEDDVTPEETTNKKKKKKRKHGSGTDEHIIENVETTTTDEKKTVHWNPDNKYHEISPRTSSRVTSQTPISYPVSPSTPTSDLSHINAFGRMESTTLPQGEVTDVPPMDEDEDGEDDGWESVINGGWTSVGGATPTQFHGAAKVNLKAIWIYHPRYRWRAQQNEPFTHETLMIGYNRTYDYIVFFYRSPRGRPRLVKDDNPTIIKSPKTHQKKSTAKQDEPKTGFEKTKNAIVEFIEYWTSNRMSFCFYNDAIESLEKVGLDTTSLHSIILAKLKEYLEGGNEHYQKIMELHETHFPRKASQKSGTQPKTNEKRLRSALENLLNAQEIYQKSLLEYKSQIKSIRRERLKKASLEEMLDMSKEF